jgi:hypothetical protein
MATPHYFGLKSAIYVLSLSIEVFTFEDDAKIQSEEAATQFESTSRIIALKKAG